MADGRPRRDAQPPARYRQEQDEGGEASSAQAAGAAHRARGGKKQSKRAGVHVKQTQQRPRTGDALKRQVLEARLLRKQERKREREVKAADRERAAKARADEKAEQRAEREREKAEREREKAARVAAREQELLEKQRQRDHEKAERAVARDRQAAERAEAEAVRTFEEDTVLMSASDASGLTSSAGRFLDFARQAAEEVVLREPELRPVLTRLGLLGGEESSDDRLLHVCQRWRDLLARAYAAAYRYSGDRNYGFRLVYNPASVCDIAVGLLDLLPTTEEHDEFDRAWCSLSETVLATYTRVNQPEMDTSEVAEAPAPAPAPAAAAELDNVGRVQAEYIGGACVQKELSRAGRRGRDGDVRLIVAGLLATRDDEEAAVSSCFVDARELMPGKLLRLKACAGRFFHEAKELMLLHNLTGGNVHLSSGTMNASALAVLSSDKLAQKWRALFDDIECESSDEQVTALRIAVLQRFHNTNVKAAITTLSRAAARYRKASVALRASLKASAGKKIAKRGAGLRIEFSGDCLGGDHTAESVHGILQTVARHGPEQLRKLSKATISKLIVAYGEVRPAQSKKKSDMADRLAQLVLSRDSFEQHSDLFRAPTAAAPAAAAPAAAAPAAAAPAASAPAVPAVAAPAAAPAAAPSVHLSQVLSHSMAAAIQARRGRPENVR